MKIAIDSYLLSLYARMLNPSDRQAKINSPNVRYSANDKSAFDIIDALETIHKSGAIFCKLPGNEEELRQFPQANKNLRECCIRGFDIKNINQRISELKDLHEDLAEECKLLAEAEECSINILLTKNPSFKDNLQCKAKNNLRIFHPIHDLKEIVK